MIILLCSADDTILKRWKDLLEVNYDLEHVITVGELKSRSAGAVNILN